MVLKNGSQQKENSVHFTGFANQAAEILNGVYATYTVTAN